MQEVCFYRTTFSKRPWWFDS